jgi:hypothetical protein
MKTPKEKKAKKVTFSLLAPQERMSLLGGALMNGIRTATR